MVTVSSPDNIETASCFMPSWKVVFFFDPRAVHLRECTECALTVDREDEEHLLAGSRLVLIKDFIDLLADFVACEPYAALHRNVQVVQMLGLNADNTSL